MSAIATAVLGSTNAFPASLIAAKRTGRPPVADPASERSRKPWLAEGCSERTYHRRKAAGTLKVRPPLHHAAHVAAWYATLGSFERLDHRAFVRRCQIDLKAAQRAQTDRDVWKLYTAAARVLH